MRRPIAAVLVLSLGLGSADSGAETTTRPLLLENDTVVRLVDWGDLNLSGGDRALLVSYVTTHPLDDPALAAEAALVWRASLSELFQRGLAHAVVVAMPRVPEPGRIEGRAWHACVTKSGEILWLDAFEPSGRCARFTSPYGGEGALHAAFATDRGVEEP